MRYAILIMAHKNYKQVLRLVNTFDDSKFDCFIHFDKKSNEELNELKKFTLDKKNVYFADNLIDGFLDTWSLVEISLELIKKAKLVEKQTGKYYKYFINLSGQDYPIKSNEYICKYLEEVYPKPIIDCTPYSEENWVGYKFNEYQFDTIIRLKEEINKKYEAGIFRKVIKAPIIAFEKIYTIITGGKTKKRLKKLKCNLYGGSAWWILPDKVINYILNEIESDKKLIGILKHTYTPEESFFQIMTMRTELGKLVDINEPNVIEQNCMTYAYFSGRDKPFKGHPYIFEKSDIDLIKNLKELFARKFDVEVDSKIFDEIDQIRNS